VLTAVAALSLPAPAFAQSAALELPAPPKRAPVELDPWLPTGAELPARTERPAGVERGCSFRAPVCVHRGMGTSAETARDALAELETAYVRLVHALGLPPPLPDLDGGGPELDLYLRSGDAPGLLVEHGPPPATRFDQAPAFCVLSGAEGALLARDASLCVGEAVAVRLDASATPHVRRAYATHLWWISGRPTSLDAGAVDDVQANPQLAVVARDLNAHSEGAALFFEHLDASLGRTHAGVLATALLAASTEKTAPGLWQWDNEPDVVDVLRHTVGDDPRSIADLFADFAVGRAFVGDRDDGARLPALHWLAELGRVRFDWVLPFSSLPRRVAPLRPLEPTGSVYLWLELDQVPADASLGFRADWEPPVVFRWTLVRVGRDGRELGRVHPAFQELGTSVEQTLVNLEGAAGILVVGTNLGGVDLKHPFDPDVAPYEPNGCTITLSRL
jgi:hypothetical protein